MGWRFLVLVPIKTTKKQGEVYLVGAGSGTADLLTLKAYRLIIQSDVVVYDRLISSDIIALIPSNAERYYVGKARGLHLIAQQDITQLLVDKAKQGKKVCRLKGGDPFIFGRGGEEQEGLAANNVSYQVVPGITAAIACSAYARIPLTHRDYAQSVLFATAHNKSGKLEHLNWMQYAQPNQTLVFYMGVKHIAGICEQLIAHGADANLPVAVVEKGGLSEQRVVTSDLKELPAKVALNKITSPALIIVGEVVKLRQSLACAEQQVQKLNARVI